MGENHPPRDDDDQTPSNSETGRIHALTTSSLHVVALNQTGNPEDGGTVVEIALSKRTAELYADKREHTNAVPMVVSVPDAIAYGFDMDEYDQQVVFGL